MEIKVTDNKSTRKNKKSQTEITATQNNYTCMYTKIGKKNSTNIV